MEINSTKPARPEGKVVFIRLTPAQYEQLDKLKTEMKGRGVATVIRRILETALAEGVTVKNGEKRRKAA